MSTRKAWHHWLRGLAEAFIGGVANALCLALGINGAEALGVDMKALDIKQLLSVVLVSGVGNAFFYLRKSPLPEDDETEKPVPDPGAARN